MLLNINIKINIQIIFSFEKNLNLPLTWQSSVFLQMATGVIGMCLFHHFEIVLLRIIV